MSRVTDIFLGNITSNIDNDTLRAELDVEVEFSKFDVNNGVGHFVMAMLVEVDPKGNPMKPEGLDYPVHQHAQLSYKPSTGKHYCEVGAILFEEGNGKSVGDEVWGWFNGEFVYPNNEYKNEVKLGAEINLDKVDTSEEMEELAAFAWAIPEVSVGFESSDQITPATVDPDPWQ